jgi:LuxR family maltose regulon positive regulatory protein
MEESLHPPRRLTLISARAGSGKTTLVSEWLHQQARPFTWLSLDTNDNDPWKFFSYLVEALRQLNIAINYSWSGEWEQPALPPVETPITELINAITASELPFILVLDDYHVIQNDWIHKAIEFLIERQPPEMHLILTTRVDPPFPLVQWRIRGQLMEIRDRDLLFTAGEVTEFLNDVMGLGLADSAVATIGMRTEGWVAGLQMAAISAEGHKQDGNLEAFIAAFGGTNRFVLDYLVEEVLHRQSPVIQDFLIETSILERMCGDLCDAVRSDAASNRDSQAILVWLERTNLFVIPLDDDRRWYRYHHLFADLLQSILRQRSSAEQIRELHRRAGQWYQAEGLPGEAMTHIMNAGDFECAASIIDENIAGLVHLFSRDRTPMTLSWIEKLPKEIRRSRPWLDVYRASMLALNLQLDEVEPILADVENQIKPDSPRASEILGHIAATRAYAANLRGEATRAIEMAVLARQHLGSKGSLAMLGMDAYTLADTYFAQDDMTSASQALSDFLKVGEESSQLMITVLALCDLAAIKKVQGQLHQAKGLYDRAYQQLLERNGLDLRVRCSYEFGVADLLREWNQLDAAYEHVLTGIEHRRRLGGYQLIGDLPLMRVLQTRGDVEGAMRALHNAELAARAHPFQLAMMLEFKTARVIQWLAAGDVETASRWAKECDGSSEQEHLALARLWLAQRRTEDASHLLNQQQALADTGWRIGRLIEILALQAITFAGSKNSEKAFWALDQALGLAEPEGFVRIFLDKGPPMVELLRRAASQGLHTSYALHLLNASGEAATARQPLIEPLSKRELEVLRRVAAGYSNNEIAQELVVAVSTVKKHINNIYDKLEVGSRTQAVARARELGLL